MSDRSNIRDTVVELLKTSLTEANSSLYYTDIDNQVFGAELILEDILAHPAIVVSLGPESTEYQGSGFRWSLLTLYFTCVVKNQDAAEEELEYLLQDIKTFIDINEGFNYTVIKPDGDTDTRAVTEIRFGELATDEGTMRPFGVGQIVVTIRYNERDARFRH